MDNETKISLSFKNNVDGEKKLERYQERLENIYALIGGLNGTDSKNVMQQLTKASSSIDKNIKATKSSADKLGNSLKTAFNLGKVSLYGRALYNLTKTFMQLSQKSTEYIENVNLLEVAYKNQNETIEESSARIEKYIQKMADVYGLDESRLTRQFGIFKQLANAMQLPTETAENLSEIMVKMTNDIASLYNLDLNRASNALQSALAGQVRPIRSATGADITEKTLQNTVLDLGLDRTISELSYVEKRLIMVISLTNQLKVSQGDYARTIESASNQIRVMHEQWDRLSRAVGNVFYPILEKVLPYVNGILMALTEIANLIVSLFGFKMPEFDYSGLSGVSDIALDIEDEMAGAGEATDNLANKLKGLRNFDKLNVINTPSASKASAGGGVGGSGYVDPKIMEAFNKAFSEYDDKLDSVRMKASKIKDDIMKWLGFEKIINPLTGETEWKYKGIGKTIENIVKWFKELSPLAKTIVGYFTYMFGKKVLTGVINLARALGSTGLFKAVKWLISPFKDLSNWIVASSLTYEGFTNKLTKGFTNWYNNISTMDAFKVAIIGVTAGIIGLNSAFKDIEKNGLDFGSFVKAEASLASMSITLGMFVDKLGILGQYGGAVGVLAGSFIGLGMAIKDGYDSIEAAHKSTTEAGKKYIEELQKVKEYSKDTADSGLVLIQRNQELAEELENIVDANGRVKQGYEERVQFILNQLNSAFGTEYQLIDGVITKNGEVITSYNEVKKSIQAVIRQKQLEIVLRAYEDEYIEALKNRKKAEEELEYRQWVINSLTERYNQSLKTGKDQYGITSKELLKSINRNKEGVASLQSAYDTANSEALKYEDLIKASASNNLNEIDYMLQQYGIKTEKQFEKYDFEAEKSSNNLKTSFTGAYNSLWDTTVQTTNKIQGQYNSMDFNSIDKNLRTPFDSAWNYILDDAGKKADEVGKEVEKKVNYYNPKMTIDVEANTSNMVTSVTNTLTSLGNILGNNSMVNKALSFRKSILGFDGGGLPPVGQLFTINERGPELLGQIGGQSFVANQNQMMDLLDRKIGNAQNNQNKPMVFNIYLDESNKLATYTLDQLEDRAKTNGQPITIGG